MILWFEWTTTDRTLPLAFIKFTKKPDYGLKTAQSFAYATYLFRAVDLPNGFWIPILRIISSSTRMSARIYFITNPSANGRKVADVWFYESDDIYPVLFLQRLIHILSSWTILYEQFLSTKIPPDAVPHRNFLHRWLGGVEVLRLSRTRVSLLSPAADTRPA
jgi:hypothetical protein